MIFVAAAILTFVALASTMWNPHAGILFSLFSRPIIDASWDKTVLGLNCLDVIGAGLPLIVLFRMLSSRQINFKALPLLPLWLVYLFSNVVAFGMILVAQGFSAEKILPSLEYGFRVLNGFVGFYAFQAYFSNRDGVKRLVIAYLLAGLFPILIGLYQAATGEIWRLRTATGGLVRHTGLYHNVIHFRYDAMMTITGILLYWSYFSKRSFLAGIVLVSYGVACLIVLHKCYSKAGIFTMAVWGILWLWLNRKLIWLPVILIALVTVNFAVGNKLAEEVSLVFLREAQVVEGEIETTRAFSGRFVGWQGMLHNWTELDLFYKLFGTGHDAMGAHNDYLRVLMSGGLLGLAIYLTVLIGVGIRVVQGVFRERSPLNVMSLMLFTGWMVDTIGLVPGGYPGYQWYVWGFIGLALHGVHNLNEQPKKIEQHRFISLRVWSRHLRARLRPH